MNASVTTALVRGHSAIVLKNQYVRAVIIPELGARVWELEDLIRGRQWIWHRGDTPLRRCPIGSVYDDVWAGGWEELFPNDAPGLFEGRNLPDHGEWWATAWDVASYSGRDGARVCLSASLNTIKVSCIKEFRLAGESETLSILYRIRSQESRPFHFLFKQHFPVCVDSTCRLALPGGLLEAVDTSFGAAGAGSFSWPYAGGEGRRIDMRIVPEPESRLREFLYVRDLPDHWCGVDDLRRGASLRMRFSPLELPFVWLFLSYGGWRGVYTAVLEPCSNFPKDLSEAVRSGRSARLEPGQEFQTEISVTLAGLVHGAV